MSDSDDVNVRTKASFTHTPAYEEDVQRGRREMRRGGDEKRRRKR